MSGCRDYPFGEDRLAHGGTNEDNGYTYEGKKKDLETDLWYNTARYFNNNGRFTQADPMWMKYPNISPYVRVGDNPLRFVDEDGAWYLKVEAKANRYAGGTLTLYNRNGEKIKSYNMLAAGAKGNKGQFSENGPTPIGVYKIGGGRIDSDQSAWKTSGSGKDLKKFGPNPRLIFGKPLSGNAVKALLTRTVDLFRIHGGPTQGGSLVPTNGCVRLSDDDQGDLYNSVKTLEENDNEENPETITVEEEKESK